MRNNNQDKIFNSIRYSKEFKTDIADKIRLSKVLNLIGNHKSVLDLGCGDGFVMEKIIKAGNNVIGVEIADNAIKKAIKKGFKVYDISLNSNWANEIKEKFDIVFAGEIIEHIFNTDLFLKNIKKVLKKRGKVIITTPNIATLGRRLMLLFGMNPLIETTARSTDAGHIRYFTVGSLKKLLNDNNFHVISNSSSVVNFNSSGRSYSKLLASIFPSLGNNIIILAEIDR